VANSTWKNPGIPNKNSHSLVRLAVRLSPNLLNPREGVAEDAMSLARRRRITFYDSVYLALAKSLSSILITADQEQLAVADGYTEALHLSELPKVRL